jgi:hypothetical protein
VGNNTTTPGATLNLLYGTDPASPAETGLKLSSTGLFTFATGQTFPGTGTITGVTTATGSGLSGGGTSGNLNLSLATNCTANQVLQWNGSAWVCSSAGTGTITGVTAGTDLTGGGSSGNVTLNVDTSQVPQLAANNVFSQNNTFEPFNTDAIDAYAIWPGKTAVVGIQNATTGGSYGVWARTADPTGAGVAGIDGSSGGGTGVVGTSSNGNAMVANGNVSQSRTGGGWVKGMVYVNGNAAPYNIVRCFNSALTGAAATTPPCGFALTEEQPGVWIVDFGFEVSDRIWSAMLGAPPHPTTTAPTIVVDNAFPGGGLNLTPSQLYVEIYTTCCGGTSDEFYNWNFTLVVY